MPAPFFDKIKLFRAAEIQPGRPAAEPPEDEPPQSFWRRLLDDVWPLLVLSAVVVSIMLTRLPTERLTTLAEGEVAPADVAAPFDLTMEDVEATAQKRAEAESAVLPVYTFDANVFANTEDKIRRLFAAGRDYVAKHPENGQSPALRQQLLETQGIDLEPADVQTLVRLKFPT